MGDLQAMKDIRSSARAGVHNQGAFRSANRATRAAEAERTAVRSARQVAGTAVGAGALGIGAGAAGAHAFKEASALDATAAAGKKVVNVAKKALESAPNALASTRAAVPSPQTLRQATKEVATAAPVAAAKPVMSTAHKIVGGTALGGVALGTGLGSHEKSAGAVERAKGLKRVGQLLTGDRVKALRDKGYEQLKSVERHERGMFRDGTPSTLKQHHGKNALGRLGGVMRLGREAERESVKVQGARAATAVAGLGATSVGVGLAKKKKKESSVLSPEREAQIKEAFGGALVAGLKGIGQFAGKAATSIGAAGKAGGLQAAGQAAANAGRSGMHRAGNFIAQNPGAGSAMVAAPALATGYLAGRES